MRQAWSTARVCGSERKRRTRVSDRTTRSSKRSIERFRAESKVLGRESVAGADRAGLQPGHEPALTLLRRTVREGIRHHVALRLLLQPVVADRRGGAHCGLDVARLDQLPLLVGARCPDTG